MSKELIIGKWNTKEVFINSDKLLPSHSQRIYNHSPDGFNWGYSGSGPAQLALAIMLRFTSEDISTRLYQKFKTKYISTLPQDDFNIEIDVREWINMENKDENN